MTSTRKSSPRKPRTNKQRRGKGSTGSIRQWITDHLLAVTIAAIFIVVAAIGAILFALPAYDGPDTRLYIPKDATDAAVKDSLKSRLGVTMGNRVYILWSAQGGDARSSHGSYLLTDGMSALKISRRLAKGMQTPVSVAFNSARTLDRVASDVMKNLEAEPEDFLHACQRVLPDSGFTEAQFPAAFIPDRYEFYWTTEPANVVRRLLAERNRFWNAERLAKARALGLTPVDVAIIASIVEEETAKTDERPKVARLYINRLQRGMRLQADPTVKFATGDFALRRITAEHLRTPSPYNTYLVDGLPPGPIRVPERKTLEAVLDAPEHDYIYMCAKEDFSGYHNFSTDYATHTANARRYQAELNRRGILK